MNTIFKDEEHNIITTEYYYDPINKIKPIGEEIVLTLQETKHYFVGSIINKYIENDSYIVILMGKDIGHYNEISKETREKLEEYLKNKSNL